MARRFAAMGRDLALAARRDRPARGAAEGTARRPPRHPGRDRRRWTSTTPSRSPPSSRELADRLGGLDRFIVNAGIGKGASIGTGKAWANRAVLLTNVLGAHAQCEAAMELFRAPGRRAPGADLVGRLGPRHAGTRTAYGASKAALNALAEGIRSDVWGSADHRHDDPARLHRDRHQRRPPRAVDRRPGQGRGRADRRRSSASRCGPTCPGGRGARSPGCCACCRSPWSAASPERPGFDGKRTGHQQIRIGRPRRSTAPSPDAFAPCRRRAAGPTTPPRRRRARRPPGRRPAPSASASSTSMTGSQRAQPLDGPRALPLRSRDPRVERAERQLRMHLDDAVGRRVARARRRARGSPARA